DLGEVRLVPDTQRVGHVDVDVTVALVDADAGEPALLRLHARPDGLQHRGAILRTVRDDVDFGAVVVALRLPHLDARPRAAIDRIVRVARAGRRLPVPDHVQRGVDAPDGVGDERVAEVLE